MKILWWFHLLIIIPSAYVFRQVIISTSKKAPYILFLLFLANYIPLVFSEALYESLSILLINIGYEGNLLENLNNTLFVNQTISGYGWHFFWVFGIISVLLQLSTSKESNYWLCWAGIFSSLILLLCYSSSIIGYLLIYVNCLAMYINWRHIIKYEIIIVLFLIPAVFFFIPEYDLIALMIWLLCAGLIIGVIVMILIYFLVSFGVSCEWLDFSTKNTIQHLKKDNNYLHDGKYVFNIFQNYLFIFSYLFEMLLIASTFEEILGCWNRILIELFYIIAALAIATTLLYPDPELPDKETFLIRSFTLGVYVQLWWLRIVKNLFNTVWALYIL